MGKEAMKLSRVLRAHRRGAATVEMAIVAPVLMSMLFGIIEFGWVFSVKQSVTNAAREGCRVATMQGATDAQIKSAITSYLSTTGLDPTKYTTTLTHATTAIPSEQVKLSVPYKQVSLMGGFFGGTDWTIGSTCTMRKEGMD
jgi:Flp pilus assembly protein TadG